MSDTIITERLLEKIILEQTPNHLHVQFDTPYQVISSAVLGGGFVEASHILNLKVRYPTNRQQEQGPIQSRLPPIRKQKKYITAASMFYLGNTCVPGNRSSHFFNKRNRSQR